MLVNLYKTKSPAAVVSLPLAIGAMALTVFFIDRSDIQYSFQWQTQLADWINVSAIRLYITSALIVYLTAIEMNRQVNVYDLYSRNTYLPGFLYGAVIFGYGHFGQALELLAMGSIVYGLGYLFRINRQDNVTSLIFMSGFFISVATVFKPMFAPALFLPWLALAVFRSFIWREWFTLILAATLPWFYLYASLFIFKGQWGLRYYPFSITSFEFSYELSRLLLITFSIFISLVGIWKYLTIATTSLLIFKKRSRILYNLFWLLLVAYGATYYLYDQFMIALTIPLVYIIAVFMLNTRGDFLTNFAVYLWLALSFWSVMK